MPLVVAAIITGAAALGTAKIMSDASDRAGKVTEKGTADTIAFEKEKAAQDLEMANSTQHANYDQWAAREGRMSSLGEMIGLPKRNIPAFQAIPGATGSTAATTGSGTAATPTGAGASASQAYFDSLFPGSTLTPDMLSSQEGKLNAQGIKLLRNAAGRAGKILLPDGTAVDVIEGAGSGLNKKQWLVQGASAPAPRTATATPYTTDPSSVLALGTASDLSPALSAPPPAYQSSRRPLAAYGPYGG